MSTLSNPASRRKVRPPRLSPAAQRLAALLRPCRPVAIHTAYRAAFGTVAGLPVEQLRSAVRKLGREIGGVKVVGLYVRMN